MSLKELLPFLTNISSYILMRIYQDLHIVTVVCGTVFEAVIALYELECFFKQHFVEIHVFLLVPTGEAEGDYSFRFRPSVRHNKI